MKKIIALLIFLCTIETLAAQTNWIRINQLGYTPASPKVAVWCSKGNKTIHNWQLVDAVTKKAVYTSTKATTFGAYGPFSQTARLDFSAYKKQGTYYIEAEGTKSPVFAISDDAYKGAADFCLRYMRQQRCGFNPFLKDSCHTRDGYSLYGAAAGIKDSTHVDATGGWHDASDYLQYVTTSANATYHLLMAYRDFPQVFGDQKQANGLDGKNGMADVLDEAIWGLDWLQKMNPSDSVMYNQVADDRDHMGMRIPKEDSFYGKDIERPVYFVSGEPQQRGKFMNASTGTSSTAGKFASAFALGSTIFQREAAFVHKDIRYYTTQANTLHVKALAAARYGMKKEGVFQTASVRSPYIYAEDNWTDDMELAATMVGSLNKGHMAGFGKPKLDIAYDWAKQEPVTPWLGKDTANHYQWYPFINIGHYELARLLADKRRDTLIGFYRKGIERVAAKAKNNAFNRGIPFIWCSNNLTVAFAIQCFWYRSLTGEKRFEALEQANIDWLFGCNPWGTSMVYGLPATGDTPVDPHSAFTHLKNYPIDGGLVDGPVYTSIFKNLIGIQLKDADEYAAFQSDLAVYHDDYGDYSTNEPTMDGTASLIYLLAAKEAGLIGPPAGQFTKSTYEYVRGAIIRGYTDQKRIALVFTGDEFAEGGSFVANTLKREKVKASFFFTGNFYRNKNFQPFIQQLKKDNHYLGPHSDKHLLYCDWDDRDKLLVSRKEFEDDLAANYNELQKIGIPKDKAFYFMPPYEWYNDTIAAWTKEWGLQLVNFTPGPHSQSDYTWPGLPNYRSSDDIYKGILQYERSTPEGLNGAILLLHLGTDPRRTDKFYFRLPQLLKFLRDKGYQFQTIDELLR